MSFSLGHFALENYIAWRQYRVLCQTKVPKALEHEIDQKTYDKSQVRRNHPLSYEFTAVLTDPFTRLTGVLKPNSV